MVATTGKNAFGHHLEKSTVAPLEETFPTLMVELETKTQNALKCVGSQLRVALGIGGNEFNHLRFEKS